MNTNELPTATGRTLASICIGCYQKLLLQMQKTRNAILASYREQLKTHEQVLRLALNEAEALAWQTDFPQLVFPTLAMEKAEAVAAWHERQVSVRNLNPALAL
jgi:hypothetical protein